MESRKWATPNLDQEDLVYTRSSSQGSPPVTGGLDLDMTCRSGTPEKPRTGQVSGQGVSKKSRSGQVYFLGFRVFGLVFFLFIESDHGERTDGDCKFGPRSSSINLTAFRHRFLHKGPVPHFVLIVSEILEAPACRTEIVQVCLLRNLGLPL